MTLTSNILRHKSGGLLLCVGFLVVFNQAACAQRNLTEVTRDDDISIEFQHVAKFGETKKYLINPRDIPNAPLIPRAYQLLTGKVFYVATQTIDLGFPLVSVHVPVNNEVKFSNARVLRLIKNEILPGGYEWEDCTIVVEDWENRDGEKMSAELDQQYKDYYAKYGPDYPKKQISCKLGGKFKSEEYFAVVIQTQNPPAKPFTDLKSILNREDPHSSGEEVGYTVTLKNNGTKDIGELNFRSNFDGASIFSVKPGQGKCQRSDWGSLDGTTVCHIGALPAGQSVVVEFKIGSNGMSQAATSGKLNIRWDMGVIIREHPDDPNWSANHFFFTQLLD